MERRIKVVERPEIVVHGTVDKPYYEIRYREIGKIDYNIGYSSYDIKNVFIWLEEEFEVVDGSKTDVVKEPSHYKHGRFEVIDEMLIAFGPQRTYDFCIMNAWKYRARAPYKGNMEQDMDKANRYLEMAKQIADANPGHCCTAVLIKEQSHPKDDSILQKELEKKIAEVNFRKKAMHGYRSCLSEREEEKEKPVEVDVPEELGQELKGKVAEAVAWMLSKN